MKFLNLHPFVLAFCLFLAVGLGSCHTSKISSNTSASDKVNLPPNQVDIRGSIIDRHYSQGQVVLEVEGMLTPNTRYNRAYVLVLPTSQIIGPESNTISLSELQIGQNVAILLRAGGKGNLVGMGVARKMWIE